MNHVREWRTGALSLIGLLAIGTIPLFGMRMLGVGSEPAPAKTATMHIDSANSLVPGAKVLLRGVAIGEVLGLDVTTEGVSVRIGYDPAVSIPLRSTMKIGNLTGLGESYLLIEPDRNDGPYLADGADIPTTDVRTPASFGDMAAAISALLTQLNPSVMTSLVNNADRALPTDPRIPVDLERSATLLTANLMTSATDLTVILDSLRDIAETPGTATNLQRLAERLGPTGASVVRFFAHAERAIDGSSLPTELTDGLIPLVARLQTFEDGVAPSVKTLASSVLPSVQSTTQTLQGIDLNRLLNAAMASLVQPGSVTVRLAPPAGSTATKPN